MLEKATSNQLQHITKKDVVKGYQNNRILDKCYKIFMNHCLKI